MHLEDTYMTLLSFYAYRVKLRLGLPVFPTGQPQKYNIWAHKCFIQKQIEHCARARGQLESPLSSFYHLNSKFLG